MAVFPIPKLPGLLLPNAYTSEVVRGFESVFLKSAADLHAVGTDQGATMTEDPIIEEVRRAGQALFKRFNNDTASVCQYLSNREDQARKDGHQVLSLPPRRPDLPVPSNKDVG